MGSLMGIVKWVAGTLVVVAVGTYIINRVGVLKMFIYGA